MPRNERFAELLAVQLASGSSIVAAAKEVGCSESHARRICRQPEFRMRVGQLRSEVTAGVVGTLTTAAAQAADTLLALLDASQEPNTRLNASKAILNALAPMTELHELRERIAALEVRQQPLRVAQ